MAKLNKSRDQLNKVRIIGGIHRSRILQFDHININIRPTPDRVRETLFNWLGQDLSGKTCLDLFAGSGAIGFEAASRNAKQVILVEKDLKSFNHLTSNKTLLKIDNLELHLTDALEFLKTCKYKFDVIFLDPPYATDLLNQCLKLILDKSLLNNNGIIYIEFANEPNLESYDIIKNAKAGMVKYALIKPNRLLK